MENPNLIAISISAFLSVFTLLTVLALIITITNRIFPHKAEESQNDAVLAAISSTVNNLYPNSKISHIEEVK